MRPQDKLKGKHTVFELVTCVLAMEIQSRIPDPYGVEWVADSKDRVASVTIRECEGGRSVAHFDYAILDGGTLTLPDLFTHVGESLLAMEKYKK